VQRKVIKVFLKRARFEEVILKIISGLRRSIYILNSYPFRYLFKIKNFITLFAFQLVGLLTIFFHTNLSEARSGEKLTLLPPLTSELNRVLKSADGLHSARINGNSDHVATAISLVIQSLSTAEKVSPMAKTEYPHLVRILSAAKKKLEQTQREPTIIQNHLLKEAFKDLVQLSRIYSLDPYNIYFCNRDQSLWLQKSSQPQNPINPDKFFNCGRLVK
jgi:hypothetical protein